MSAFDMGLRLAANRTGLLAPRSIHRLQPIPLGPLVACIAVPKGLAIATPGDAPTVVGSEDPTAVFTALYAAGFNPESVLAPTLIVLNRAALGELNRAAHTAATHGDPRVRGAAAIVGGYTCASGEYPGSSGVCIALDAARARWATGDTPHAETHLSTWTRWLATPAEPVAALHAIAARVIDGAAMPFEHVVHDVDRARYRAVCNRFGEGRDWRSRDSRKAAALGLASREHAAEIYEAGLLTDPIYAAAAIHDGTVTDALVTTVSINGVTVVVTFASRLPVCRLRSGKQVDILDGTADHLPTSALHRRNGTVTDVTVAQDGTVLVAVRVPRPRDSAVGLPTVGARYLITPQRPDARMQARSRASLAGRYSAKQSWLAGNAPPRRIDRDVPLDVIIRAADH